MVVGWALRMRSELAHSLPGVVLPLSCFLSFLIADTLCHLVYNDLSALQDHCSPSVPSMHGLTVPASSTASYLAS